MSRDWITFRRGCYVIFCQFGPVAKGSVYNQKATALALSLSVTSLLFVYSIVLLAYIVKLVTSYVVHVWAYILHVHFSNILHTRHICSIQWAYLFLTCMYEYYLKYMLQFVIFWHVCANILCLYVHMVCFLCKLYLQCVNHFCSVLYIKSAYSVLCFIVDGSNFICSIYLLLFFYICP